MRYTGSKEEPPSGARPSGDGRPGLAIGRRYFIAPYVVLVLLGFIAPPQVRSQSVTTSAISSIPYRTQDLGGSRVKGGAVTMDVSFASPGGISSYSPGFSLQQGYIGEINEPPQLNALSVKDDLNREITETSVVFVRQAISVTATFQDPDQPDSQTATIDWGDGPPLALGSVTPGASIKADHVYTTKNNYTVTLTVADAANAIGAAKRTVTMISPAEGMTNLVAFFSNLLKNPALNKKGIRGIQKAIDDLLGRDNGHGGDGALAKLQQGDLDAALDLIGRAIDDLDQAAKDDDSLGNLGDAKTVLNLAAASIVAEAIAVAENAASKPNDAKKIADAKALLRTGMSLIGQDDYAEDKPIEQFRKALAAIKSISNKGGESVSGPLRLALLRISDNSVHFRIYGSPSATVELERSRDFQNWEKLESATLPLNGWLELKCPSPEGDRAAFFRVTSAGTAVK